jgi:threonine dehydrogenase-like Zn-dependent dehydrogenase
MRALRYHGPHDVRWEEVDTPWPESDEVLVRIEAAGICGTDVEIYEGTMFFVANQLTAVPFTPGHEWSGEVVGVGSEVAGFAEGDRVTGECSVGCRECRYCLRGWYNQCANRTETGILNRNGGFAEFIAFPHHYLHRCDGLSAEAAAQIEPTGVALYAVKNAGVCPDDVVVVVGAGPIGLYAVQAAKAYGARTVILVDVLDDRLALGAKVGADATINAASESTADRVRDVTDGNLADVVIEATGKASAWDLIPPMLAPRARVAMVGLFAGERCQVDFDPLVLKDISIFGTVGGPSCWPEAIDLHRRGLVTADPLVTHRLPMDRFEEGIRLMRDREDGAVKVMLYPDANSA